ncbi:hypothetical protein AFLA_008844 [Aspergillus flavus NRRL3357]|nr:hypothetical protein AFLA_008844 [Aspergillus flavus NRRL3357]
MGLDRILRISRSPIAPTTSTNLANGLASSYLGRHPLSKPFIPGPSLQLIKPMIHSFRGKKRLCPSAKPKDCPAVVLRHISNLLTKVDPRNRAPFFVECCYHRRKSLDPLSISGPFRPLHCRSIHSTVGGLRSSFFIVIRTICESSVHTSALPDRPHAACPVSSSGRINLRGRILD